MALPVTITGLATTLAPVGPFKTSALAPGIVTGPQGSGSAFDSFGLTGQPYVAQTFTTIAAMTVIGVQAAIKIGGGAPADGFYLEIKAVDGNGYPTGAALGTSQTIPVASVNATTFTKLSFTFSNINLNAATKYAVVVCRSGALSGTTYYSLCAQSGAYANGSGLFWNGTTWNQANQFYINVASTTADTFYFFGRDGTTATTLQAYKATDPAGSTPLIDTLSGTASGRQVGTSATYTQLSQSFTTVGAFNLKSVGVSLAKIGSPADNILADVYAASGGLPTGSSLGQATALAASSVAASQTEYTLTWVTPVALSAATQYCIVLSRSGAVNSSNNIAWGGQSGSSSYSGGFFGNYNGSVWSADVFILESTLKVYDVIPTAWSSIATKTGFTTAILNLQGYQVGSTIHLLVNDGTASTLFATKYVSFDASTDTFLATIETVSAAVAVTGQIAGAGAGASLVVRGNGEVVAFYSGVQAKVSGTFRAHVYYRRRTAVNTWSTETMVDPNTAVDNNAPTACLGASDRVHFSWNNQTGVAYRTLSAANALNTAASSLAMSGPGDAVSYDRAGTTKVVVTSNDTSQSAMRFDSADNPTVSFASALATNTTTPHRIGVDPLTLDVTIVYRSSVDSDLYAIKSTNDGANWSAPVSFFVGTVAASDANLSKSSTGSLYSRGGSDVVGYVVNDNGTWKYNESVVRAPATADAWNVNDKSTNTVLSNGDKTANNPSTTAAVRSTTKRLNGAAGKYYAEIQAVTKFSDAACNVGIKDASAAVVGTPFAARINGFGDIYIGSTYSGITTTAPVNGGIISLAWDTGAELFWVRTTDNWNGNVANDPATGVGGIDFSSAAAVDHALWSQSGTFTIRTRAVELTQVAPSGFLSWMGETLTVANNGALDAATSSVSGSGIVASAGTGTLNAQSATTVGSGIAASVGTGALVGQPSTLVGTGIASWNATGVLSASVASASGAGLVQSPPVTGTGVLTTSVAALASSGTSSSVGTAATVPATDITIAGGFAGNSNFGDIAHPKAGQGFVATAKFVKKIRLLGMSVGAGFVPTDGVLIKIYAVDGNHAPVAQVGLASDIIPGPSLRISSSSPVDFIFSTPVQVAVGTEYMFVLERTGALSSSRYSFNIVNEGYGGTALCVQQFDGAAWVPILSGGYDLYSIITTADAVGLEAQKTVVAGAGVSGSVGYGSGYPTRNVTITGSASGDVDIGATYAQKVSQGFIAVGDTITSVALKGLHYSPPKPTDSILIKIFSVDASHNPLAQIGVSSNAIAASSLPLSAAPTTFTFTPPVPVTNGAEYAFVIERTGAINDAGEVYYFASTNEGYGGPTLCLRVWDGSIWDAYGNTYEVDSTVSLTPGGYGPVAQIAVLAGVGLAAWPPITGTGAFSTGVAAIASSGTVASTGTAILTSSVSAVVGISALAPVTGTGTLASQSATAVGIGVSSSRSTFGALPSSVATLSGIGIGTANGTGTLSVLTLSTLVGVGVSRSVSTFGALAPLAAVTAGAGLSRSVSTSASLSVSAAAIGSVGISQTTGTGTLACSVATLVGVGLNTATGTGALTSFATLSGFGVARWVSTGILNASIATAVGTGITQWIATGTLNSNLSTLAGAGASSSTQTASALQASLASLSGFQGVVIVSGTGTLPSQSAVAVGAAVSRSLGTGALLDATAALAGAGLSGTQGASLLAPTACVITASGKSISSGTATLSAGTSAASGVGGIAAAPTGTGILLSGASSVTGVGSAALTASGILNAQSATVSGSGTATWIASGVLASSVSVAAGAGLARWSGLGVLTSVAATTVSLGASSSAGSASLLSARASVFGAEGVVVIQGAGALQAQSRVIAGVGAARHTGSGALFSQDHAASGIGLGKSFGTGLLSTNRSVLDAVAIVQATGSGLLAAKRSLMAGFASLTAYGSGDLVSISAIISGNDFVSGLGTLPSSSFTMVGEGLVNYPAMPEPDPLPGSYPGTTTWGYAGTAGWVNPGTRGWVNPGTAEWRKRAA